MQAIKNWSCNFNQLKIGRNQICKKKYRASRKSLGIMYWQAMQIQDAQVPVLLFSYTFINMQEYWPLEWELHTIRHAGFSPFPAILPLFCWVSKQSIMRWGNFKVQRSCSTTLGTKITVLHTIDYSMPPIYTYTFTLGTYKKWCPIITVCPIIHAVRAYQKNVSIPYGFEPVFNQMVCIVGGVGTLYIHTVWVTGSW